MIENETLEFKKSTSEINEAIVSIVSILNKHKHGELYFGLKNDGTPYKFEINDSTLRDVSRKIYEAIKPQIFPNIDIVKINNIDVIKVEFYGEDVPYSAFGRYYIRIADEDRELTPNELRKIMISKEYEENWCDKLSSFDVNDVKEESILKFYESATDCGRLPKIGFDIKSLLTKQNLLINEHLTNAGVVLFSKHNPITLKLVVLATNEKTTILDMETLQGNIFDLIDGAMDFIVKNIRWKVLIDDSSLQRKEIPEIPVVALREVIINSFAHARYDGNVQHEIDIYSNRISIINPGSFANDYSPDDFVYKDLKSYLRNQSIANVLYLCKDVEACGHGLKKVYNLCRNANVNVSYIKNENDFTMEFSRIDRNTLLETDNDENYNNDLTTEEVLILNVLKTNKKATKKNIIEKTNISSRTIDRIIRSLKDKEILKRVGSKKIGFWEVF